MIQRQTRPVSPSVPQRLSALTGGLMLVATGLGSLALIAVTAPTLWDAPPQTLSYQPPEIWLSSLAPTPVSRFAAADAVLVPILPTDRPMIAPRAPRAAATDSTSTTAVVASAAPAEQLPRPQPSVDLAAAPMQAETVDPLELAALNAPRRSPMPRARPLIAAQPATTPEPALASLPSVGLLASLMPQRRPETVARLASLDLPPAVEPAPRAPVISAPALDEAIANSDRCDASHSRAIPRRAGRSGEGSAVIGRLTGLGGAERDRAITDEVLAGNVPDFLRDLVPVTFSGTGANGQRTRVTICVTPDYLAVGSDRDFVRVPLGLPAAMRVAETFDMVLPTTRMVDAIYAQANVRLSPAPMDPGAQMASTGYFLRHNATVEGQRSRAGARLGQLVSGHKKDLVLTNRLNANPGRVAIYGWHRQGGSPIQPLSTVHGASYADYSHGIRLVSRRAYVNGRAVDLRDLLADSRLAGLVSSEGTITNRQMLAALR